MLGIIGGTSLLEFQFADWKKKAVHTPYGSSEILTGPGVALLLRHQNRRAPHRINYRSHLAALAVSGVDRIISIGSTGSLRSSLHPGSLVIPDDYFCIPSLPSIYDHSIGHVPAGFSPEVRELLAEHLPEAEQGGTYIQTIGPRFETPAEIRWMSSVADLVGMTVVSEAAVAQELGIPFAAICTVDNYANGISAEPVTYDQIVANSRLFSERTGKMLRSILDHCS